MSKSVLEDGRGNDFAHDRSESNIENVIEFDKIKIRTSEDEWEVVWMKTELDETKGIATNYTSDNTQAITHLDRSHESNSFEVLQKPINEDVNDVISEKNEVKKETEQNQDADILIKEEIEVKEEPLHIHDLQMKVNEENEKHNDHKTCANGDDLVNHRTMTSIGEIPYQFINCDKNLSQKSHIKNHMRSHTRQKPYICSNCDRNCSYDSSIKSYLRKNTGEKSYKCSHCDKVFISISDFKCHVNKQTEEKSYKCSHCEKNFRDIIG
ncbi:unnamed protein product, partial [Meganyctiphanes norvegica]